MKRYLIALLVPAFILLTAFSCAKHKNREKVPEVVVEEFDKDNKEAENVCWELKNKNYEAKYEEEGVEKVAIYSPKGKKLRVEVVVKEKDVPEVVVIRLKKRYPRMELQQIVYVERPKQKPIYLVKVKDSRAITNVEISLTGVILKTVVLESFEVKVQQDYYVLEHLDCDDHHKHKHKHKHGKHNQDDYHEGHGNCKDDHHDGHGVIHVKLKN
jgi:CRISPR/Cas system-associated exonuclease Cas4 (RecB family)